MSEGGGGMVAVAEQRHHLRLRHRIPDPWAAPERREAATQPHARGLTALGVVIAQGIAAAGSDVARGDLPGQVGVARPRRQLVQRHHWRPTPSPRVQLAQ
jgi:hypothetical protein